MAGVNGPVAHRRNAQRAGAARPESQPRAPHLETVLASAGNRALARLASTERGRRALEARVSVRGPRGRRLQRVGEQKISYAADKDAPAESLALLTASLDQIRAARRKRKTEFEAKQLAGLPKEPDEKKRQKIVMSEYVKALEMEDWTVALTKTDAFTAGKLKLTGMTVTDKDGKAVATLAKGEVFDETPSAATKRKTYKKRSGAPDRTYVNDDRGVKTRRYAYVEKSIYQMMQFVRAGELTGRYQRIHEEMKLGAVGKAVTTISPELTKMLALPGATDLVKLAALHQWLGSGMQQRGLSLASTPRKDAVFSNHGESFKSGDGVLITIDLAKVPEDVKLINHYAYSGTKDVAAGVESGWIGSKTKWVGRGTKKTAKSRGAYAYTASVIKNRELYLERLEPEWVEHIEVHGVALPPVPPGKTGKDLLQWVGAEIGYQRYLSGYRDALDPPTTPRIGPHHPMYTVGQNAGNAYADGYAVGKASATVAEGARWNTMETQFRAADKALQRKEDYWVGWAHAAAGIERGKHIPPPPVVPTTPPPESVDTAVPVDATTVVGASPPVVVPTVVGTPPPGDTTVVTGDLVGVT